MSDSDGICQRAAVHFTVAAQGRPLLLIALCQLFHQIDRAVLPAGAANGHGHIAAVVGVEHRQPVVQKLRNMSLHGLHVGLLPQKVLHRCILAGQRAQLHVVVGVGQHAHIKHIVGIDRNAVLETKGLEHQRHLVGWRLQQLLHIALQLRTAYVAGVDDVGVFADFTKQLALAVDDLNQRLACLRALWPLGL